MATRFIDFSEQEPTIPVSFFISPRFAHHRRGCGRGVRPRPPSIYTGASSLTLSSVPAQPRANMNNPATTDT